MSAAATTAPRPGLGVWLMAARPATLPAAVVPVLVGSALAASQGQFKPLPFVAAMLASILIQVGTNFANDYFDYLKGADAEGRLGPVRVTQAGLVSPKVVRNAMTATFALAVLVGAYLVSVGGLPILAIGVLSVASGVLYTGGPWPLAYHGLGDVFVFVFFGLVAVMGSAYLHQDAFTAEAFYASLPVAALVTAILAVNNLRDADTDRKVHKNTLAVILGKRFTRWEYTLLILGAYVYPAWRVTQGASLWSLLPLLTLPIAVRLIRGTWTLDGRPLNAILKGTGQLHLLFGVLLSVALLLA